MQPIKRALDRLFPSFQQGGEMGERMRSHDWSRSPLGPPETWPISLRALVRLILEAKQPMFVAWGPQLAFLYNDAYAPIFGAKHPDALGRPFAEVWSDIWLQIRPLVDSTLAGQGSWHEDLLIPMQRHGYEEEAYFSFSYTPAYGDDGAVAGMFCAATETTEKVLAERQKVAERQRLERMFEQAPGMMVMLRGPDHVFELANTAYYQLVGERTLVGRTVREALPEVAGQGFFELLDRVYQTGEPFVGHSLPARFQRSAGGPLEERFVDFIYQPIRDATGQVTGIFVEGFDVTERKNAEEALRRSEARLRSILEIRTVGVMFWSESFGLTEMNEAFLRMTGFSREEALGKTWQELTPEEFHPGSLRAVDEVTTRGETTPYEKQYFRKDGSRWWGLFAARKIGQEVVEFVLDVTDRREAEQALRDSEERLSQEQARLKTLIDNLPVGVCFLDPSGRALLSNPSFRRFIAEAEPIPSRVPDADKRWLAWDESGNRLPREGYPGIRALSGETVPGIEFLYSPKEGPEVWTRVSGLPILDAEGRVAAALVVVVDIDAQKRAQEALQRLNENLEAEVAARTAERDKIWQNSNELMAVFGNDGRRLAINPAWRRVLGYDEEALLHKPMQEITHPEDREILRTAVTRLMRGEIVNTFEDRVRHADGSYRTIAWTGVPGEGVFYAIGRDVTEQRRTEEALRQAQKMEAIGQLTGGVAHDFNNLLTIIKSSTDLLRRRDLAEERRSRYVDAISDTVDRASRLTGQLLAFARRQALKPEAFDVPERVRAVSDMVRTIVGARIAIVTEIGCERCFAEADVAQFETALVNMAVNARDAMDGEGTLTIRVEAMARLPALRGHAGGPGEFVAVSLADTGSGIAPDQLSHIFEPFYTTKDVGKGTGLGLSQVYGFAKQSGGDVDVQSEVGRGTTFTLYLPRVEAGPEEAAGLQTEAELEAGHGRRVLVVEDNTEVGQFSTQILQDLGYVTTWAANGDEALRLLEGARGGFDVVFSDVVMPGMSGVELGQEIRRLYPGLPVVLTSGYSHVLAEDSRHGFELLHKPYAAEELSRVLRRVAQRRRGPAAGARRASGSTIGPGPSTARGLEGSD